jgi:hypothetical protein
MPSPDIIFIHDDPHVGDYAVYYIKESNITNRFEVYAVTDKAIDVRYRMNYLDPGYKDLAPKEWYYRQIDHDGKVLKAWAETDAGQTFATPVAKAGMIGSLEYLTKLDKKVAKPFNTKGESLEVDAINTYIYRTDVGLISTNSSCLEYYSDVVPFRVLRREMLHTANVGGFLKATEYINAVGTVYLTDNYMSLYNTATKGDMKYQSTVELIEYGFAR